MRNSIYGAEAQSLTLGASIVDDADEDETGEDETDDDGVFCHGCGETIAWDDAHWDNGDPWCDGCFVGDDAEAEEVGADVYTRQKADAQASSTCQHGVPYTESCHAGGCFRDP